MVALARSMQRVAAARAGQPRPRWSRDTSRAVFTSTYTAAHTTTTQNAAATMTATQTAFSIVPLLQSFPTGQILFTEPLPDPTVRVTARRQPSGAWRARARMARIRSARSA